MLDGFLALGVNCLHPVEAPPTGDTPLAEAKARLRGRLCIEGNIQYDHLCRRPTREFVRLVQGVIETAAPGGGFILSVTASPYHTVLPEQAAQNYVALLETGARQRA